MTTILPFTGTLTELRLVMEEIEQSLRAAAYPERDIFGIKLALEEALVNAIKHGNQMDPDKRVHVTYTVTPERFEARVADEGNGFDCSTESDPTAPIILERPHGRGILLMRAFMTEVIYPGKGNVVVLVKVRDTPPEYPMSKE